VSDRDPKDYYKILGVQPDAPASVIRDAYRALVMELHPDRNPHRDTTTQFQNLQAAYAALSDENVRQQYDANSVVPLVKAASRTGNDEANRRFFNKRFVYRSLLLLLFAGLVAAGIYRHGIDAAEAEKIRLERQGVEAEKAAAIAAAEAGTLDSMEKPLPENGVLRFADRHNYNLARSPTFRVINSLNVNALMKLIRVKDGAEVMSVFIRAGQTAEVTVPVGNYNARIASGQTWYGNVVLFGPTTRYSRLDAILEFKKTEGSQLLGNEITLARVKDGNLRQSPLAAAEF
jgi:curved DNA-binding protein CbpA